MTTTYQPPRVYDLIAAIDDYEQIHGDHDNGWPCLHNALEHVPEQELDRARAIAGYGRQKPAAESTVIHRTEYVVARDDVLDTLVTAARTARR